MRLNRRYIVARTETTENLAQVLTESNRWGAQGFELDGSLYLPDAAAQGGPHVYAVVQIQADRRVDGTGVVSGFLVDLVGFDDDGRFQAMAQIAAIQTGLYSMREPVIVLVGGEG
jgi:xanthine dehydrogenase molybdopterin-binding subunit B